MCSRDIHGWRIVDYLGGGGFGTVFVVDKAPLRRLWAMKILGDDLDNEEDDPLARFEDEARAASGLTSPHVVPVIDMGSAPGVMGGRYLIMELAPGITLRKFRLEAGGRVAWWKAAEVAVGICHGLAEAHAQGIVHRDLKPDNIVVAATPQGLVARVLDFGIALIREQARKTKPNLVMGTPGYISPEQWRQEPVDGRSDVYALGVVLAEQILGRNPFNPGDIDALAVGRNHLSLPPPPLPDEVPGELRNLVARMLAKEPEGRPSAQEAHDVLLEVTRTAREETVRRQLMAGWRQTWLDEESRLRRAWEEERAALETQLFAEADEATRLAREQQQHVEVWAADLAQQREEHARRVDDLEAGLRKIDGLREREEAVRRREHEQSVATARRWAAFMLLLLAGFGLGFAARMVVEPPAEDSKPADEGLAAATDLGGPSRDSLTSPRDALAPPRDAEVSPRDAPPPARDAEVLPPDATRPGLVVDASPPQPEVRICNPWTGRRMRARLHDDAIELLERLDTNGETDPEVPLPWPKAANQDLKACHAAGRRFSLVDPDGLSACWAAAQAAGTGWRRMELEGTSGPRLKLRTVSRKQSGDLCAP